MKIGIASIGIISIYLATTVSCAGPKKRECNFIEENTRNAVAQYTLMTDRIENSGKILNPRTVDKNGNIHFIDADDWCSGFFPGSLWMLYELTGDTKWSAMATKYTESLDKVQYLTSLHDVGFMIGCSYLNGYRHGVSNGYKQVIVQAARSLSTRFCPNAGVIQSWDTDRGWQAERNWKCPVIIDNMMNLELLFEASRLSNDDTFYNIAVTHANTTLKNHFRPDFSCYHVVDYDPQTGEVLKKQTAQGCSDESSWARGQAWALYGYTMCYRYTHDYRYLEAAEKICNFIFTNKNLPKDLIPYWDFDAPNIPDEPRDASSAACMASALYELHTYVPNKNYKTLADKIMKSLGSPAYRAKVGTNGYFILMHSVGSIPHCAEIDVPLNYADYYFLEALTRKRDIENNRPFGYRTI